MSPVVFKSERQGRPAAVEAHLVNCLSCGKTFMVDTSTDDEQRCPHCYHTTVVTTMVLMPTDGNLVTQRLMLISSDMAFKGLLPLSVRKLSPDGKIVQVPVTNDAPLTKTGWGPHPIRVMVHRVPPQGNFHGELEAKGRNLHFANPLQPSILDLIHTNGALPIPPMDDEMSYQSGRSKVKRDEEGHIVITTDNTRSEVNMVMFKDMANSWVEPEPHYDEDGPDYDDPPLDNPTVAVEPQVMWTIGVEEEQEIGVEEETETPTPEGGIPF